MAKSIAPVSGTVEAALVACRQHFVHAALFSAFLNILYLAPSLYMLQVYDRVVPTRGVPTLVMLTLIFTAAIGVLSTLDYLRSRLLILASGRLDRLLAGPVLNALLRAAAKSPRSSNVLREFDQLRQTITGAAILALFDAPWAPIYVAVCFLLHPALGLLATGGAVLLMALSWLNERATREPLKAANVANAVAYMAIDESLVGAGLVQSLGMRGAMVTRLLEGRSTAYVLQVRASFAGASYMALIKAARLLLGSFALGLGALLVVKGELSGGAIFAASLLITRALSPIEQISGAWKAFIQAYGAYTSVGTLLAEEGNARPTTALPAPRGEIAVEGLAVRSPDGSRSILADVGFRLEAGQMLGVVGASGAGKSTLAAALAGAVPAAAGSIRLDGANLADWPEQQLHEVIGYAPQATALFRGTVKANIARFADPADPEMDAKVIAAAQACGAHEFILSLPMGYDSELGFGGTGLSTGQAQRITLARALFHRPRALILDEPNAALDQFAEAQLELTLRRLRTEGVTIIVVAHRTGLLADADLLMILNQGRITGFGPPDQLLRQQPAVPARSPSTPVASAA